MAYNTALPVGTINAVNWGADPTGAADSTAALIAAHATGKVVYYPTGNYTVSSTIAIPGGGIVGDGSSVSLIFTSDVSSADVYNYTGAFAGLFQDFSILASAPKAGGSGVRVTGTGTGEVSSMRFLNCIFNNLPICINFVRASLWTVTNCSFFTFTTFGISVDNQNAADSGDSSIIGCVFAGGGNGSACIKQISSGGLKITGNKFNNAGVHYLMALGPLVGAPSTSDLLITGNSFEGSVNANVQFQRATGTGTFANVAITGNQFLVTGTTGSAIFAQDSSGFLSNFNISGNVFTVNPAGASGIALDYINGLVIDGNILVGAGASLGIFIGSHATNSLLGTNQVSGFTTPFSLSNNTLAPSNRARVLARNNSAQSIPNTTPTTITGWTSSFDASSNFTAATGTFTAPATGFYLVTAGALLNGAMAAGTFLSLNAVVSGGAVIGQVTNVPNASNSSNSLAFSGLVSLAAAQTLVLQITQVSGGAIPLNASLADTYFSITQQP